MDEAINILLQAEENFKRIQPSYLSIIYFYLGSTYLANENWKKGEEYFRKAVDNIDQYKVHFDAKAECLSRLALCLNKQKRFEEAYEVLRESKRLYDNTFSTKSFNNAGLLSIRNMYIEQLEERDKIILERDNELFLQKAKVLRIQMILLLVFAVFSIAALFWYLRLQKKKFKDQKEEQRIKTALEKEHNRVILETKNKELTSFTLQLIDKDTVINDMEQAINQHASNNVDLLRSVKGKTAGRINLWEEFDTRFIDVNKGFYENLKTRYPDLTPTELKHCALIKLNSSAKEMAQLLNISINGVNTSRYRIRKKLKLEREDNLTQIIGEL